jgi:hypothetical protein
MRCGLSRWNGSDVPSLTGHYAIAKIKEAVIAVAEDNARS